MATCRAWHGHLWTPECQLLDGEAPYHQGMSHSQADSISSARILHRGQPGYEAARRAALWNARLPDRYPDVIVQACDVNDVVAAIRLAKRDGLRVGVRSGGHSWAGNHIRSGGLLLDVSRLDQVRIDRHAMRATAGPGCHGNQLLQSLMDQGLFFPVGHCRGVCIGGYLLQGGFGWNGRVLGPACQSVLGLDIVTADGDIVHASETENPDLYWAARGSGPGFFGVVTRFHLRLYPRPGFVGHASHLYPIEALPELFRFAHAVRHDVPRSVEFQLMMRPADRMWHRPRIEVFAPVFADGIRKAWADLRFLNSHPIGKRATLKIPLIPTRMSLLYTAAGWSYPDNHRYSVDNLWTRASIDDLLPHLQTIAQTMPPSPSHMLWLNWMPSTQPVQRADMAFSMEDEIYIALYGAWRDAADDAKYDGWSTERVRAMAHLASGCQLADENLGRRPARFMADGNLARLDRVRSDRDPQGRFHPYMGRP